VESFFEKEYDFWKRPMALRDGGPKLRYVGVDEGVKVRIALTVSGVFGG
jgi:hypothetical protein